jgi:mannose-6-phosphate isomerase-like protein (cupin superfamily)
MDGPGGLGYAVVDRRELAGDELGGREHGAGVSLIFVDLPPGAGVRLHRHAYQEVFVVREGRATFRVGSETLDVAAPQIVVVQAGVAHGFVNSGDGPLRQVDIHVSDRIVTEWLED